MSNVSQRQQPEMVAKVGRTQADVVSRRQLRDCGYDADAVQHRVASGRWQSAGLAVVLHNGPLTTQQHHWSAILTAPSVAAIGGRTACAIYGLTGFPATLGESVHDAASITARAAVTIGIRRAVEMSDDEKRRLRRHSTPNIATGFVPCALVIASVQQRLTDPKALRELLTAAGMVRHGRVLRLVLADIEGGADSLAEIDLAKLARRAGLPPPIRQSIRRDRSGRRRFLDADFGTFSVEIDGGFHIRPMNYWADARRHNDLLLVGQRILRFPSVAIRLEPEMVIAQLRAAKAIFG